MKNMLNLFKSANQLVKEIHNEFDTAEDRLLTQADNLLKELNIETETQIEKKAKKLVEIGFLNSETVVVANKMSERRMRTEQVVVKSKEDAELIRYYKHCYPFQKFLTEVELERICKKYSLIFAPVKNYVKDVPEKNISEILLSTPLKELDVIQNRRLIRITRLFSEHLPKEVKDKLSGVLDVSGVSGYDYDRLLRGNGDITLKNLFNIQYGGYLYSSAEMVEENRGGLFIAAPPSHFNLSGLSKVSKYGYLNVFKTEIKDPIVFRYCRGGIQVLSKWGLEASDESLINEIEN